MSLLRAEYDRQQRQDVELRPLLGVEDNRRHVAAILDISAIYSPPLETGLHKRLPLEPRLE